MRNSSCNNTKKKIINNNEKLVLMNKEYIYIIITGILYGTLVFGGQIFVDFGLSLYELSMFTFVFGILLLPFIFKKEKRPRKTSMALFLLLGLFGALTTLSQFGALILGIPVAIVVLLLYTQPLWTIIFGRIFLNEKINRNKISALFFVLFGVTILVNPFEISNIGNIHGIILALLGGICLSGWVICGRKSGIEKEHFITTTFVYMMACLFFLIISYPIVSFFISDPAMIRVSFNQPILIWALLFFFVLISEIMPSALFFKGVQKVSASDAGIILLLEPVSASVLATVFLKQPLSLNILIGGALILISNYIIIKKDRKSIQQQSLSS